MFFLLDFTALALLLEERLEAIYIWRDFWDRLAGLGLMLALAWWLLAWRWGWSWWQAGAGLLWLAQAGYLKWRLEGRRLSPWWLAAGTWLAHAGRGFWG
ncbi:MULTISPECIES: hypothetical protein [Carboxydocella]|uniref:Uncharacterized protein n=2 Tax=Carboxydocella TaxID=178898 RepID=A0A1T4L608_9FIRM|nr:MULTISPECIES: hypothetical protein [Carboxydocella]AVX19954.1 hypothetical protein CFE_0755 [Carboxydocella thermautotrophica]AVX30376.1 hypothetical protein CTH_0773 [Carboxydocella thermautotrophica]SJZ50017.1 hypothetical protein SAMN02745885_00034 [Carboxydocella sporoproducens DSM 16521]GAW28009.1 hypothetical protein ULO1_05790 [Carboxydocella sp. ULO1]GAW32752.1 hypothetical protein JDF658_25170 [Carboxydocella sp. JDF658]